MSPKPRRQYSCNEHNIFSEFENGASYANCNSGKFFPPKKAKNEILILGKLIRNFQKTVKNIFIKDINEPLLLAKLSFE